VENFTKVLRKTMRRRARGEARERLKNGQKKESGKGQKVLSCGA